MSKSNKASLAIIMARVAVACEDSHFSEAYAAFLSVEHMVVFLCGIV